MIIKKGKVKIESKPINTNGGMVIEVNGKIAISVIYDEFLEVVYCNLFHKDLDEPCASRIFLELEERE